MSAHPDTRREPGRSYAVPVGALAGTAAVPLAMTVHPPGMPAYWALVALMMAGSAAGRATRPARQIGPQLMRRPVVRAAGWAGLAIATETVWRALIALAAYGALPPDLVDGATLGVAAVTAIGFLASRRLAAQIHDATCATIGAGEIRPLGVSLIGGGIVVLIAAGWTTADTAVPPLMAALLTASTFAYGLTGVLVVYRVRRAGLTTRWQTSRRTVDPQVSSYWSIWTTLTAAAALVAASVLWLPPVGRARDGFHLLAWLRGQLGDSGVGGRPDGEILYWWFPDDPIGPADITAQTLVAIAAVVLLGGLAVLLARRRGRRVPVRRSPQARGLLLRSRLWLRTLLAAVAAMLRGSPPHPRRAAGRDPRPSASTSRLPRLQSWWRPSDPRQRVIHHYERTLHRAAKHGIPRPHWQPPLDYADTLRGHLPSSTDDIDQLTDLFVTARYSHHAVPARDARLAEDASRKLRSELRRGGQAD